jgi:hypothetical protein
MKVSGQIHAPAALTPGKEPAVLTGWEVGWDPEPVRTLWRKGKSLAPAGNGTPAVNTVPRRYTD